MDPGSVVNPDWFTEDWWNWVFANYKTSIAIVSSVVAVVVKSTKTSLDDKILAVIKEKVPWKKPDISTPPSQPE